MTDESTMVLSSPDGKRGRDPGNTVYQKPSPNPQDKKTQRNAQGGKTTSPLDAVLGEIEENPTPAVLVASNLLTKFDDQAQADEAIDLTKEDEDTDDEEKNKDNDKKKKKQQKKKLQTITTINKTTVKKRMTTRKNKKTTKTTC